MADMMRVKDAAKLWGISERRVIALCQNGKIKGAVKNGRSWEFPANTTKPADSRVKKDTYVQTTRPVNLPLPIGISDYRLASTEYYYIDKTMMIKDFLDERPMFSLFTRPRRFGKTLNMDMFRTFFGIVNIRAVEKYPKSHAAIPPVSPVRIFAGGSPCGLKLFTRMVL